MDFTPTESRHFVALAFLFAMETAMRAGEICGLTWDRVYLDKRFVRLKKTKNGDARDVALSRRVVELLKCVWETDRTEENTVFSVSSACLDALYRKYHAITAQSHPEVKSIHFHDTRHEAITRLARKLDALDLARMIGHRDLKSLMIYYNATASDIAGQLD